MSKIIATSAINGAYTIVAQAKKLLARARQEKGPDAEVGFPDTGYFLPVIYSMLGEKVRKLSDLDPVLGVIDRLLPPKVADATWLPYLGHTLDAGMATLFAEEILEACKYLVGPNPVDGIYLGAASDVILRERGIEFVDGRAPGFAAIVGAAPTNEQAVAIARECQEKSLYVFLAGHDAATGKSFSQQLEAEGVQLGWETRLVPFGHEITAAIYALGFASRAALAFGGVQPGDFRRNLIYNKNRVFAFVLALGEVTDEWYATAAGAINYGFPVIANTDIPQILPTGVCTYEHVVSEVPPEEMVSKAIEVRGLKITVSKIDIPVPHSPAFEGERIRREDMHCEFGGKKSKAVELVRMREMDEINDGDITLEGPDVDQMEEGGAYWLGVRVEVAGRKMQADFEPILERQIHRFFNEAQGIFHMGQRSIAWVRISKEAKKAGWKMEHFGKLLHAKIHGEYSSILDKVAVRIFTEEPKVKAMIEEAEKIFDERDRRLGDMTDEAVDIFYSCTLCQSFAPTHVCVITPERSGLCGAYSWLDGKANYEIQPTGPNQPLDKGECLDDKAGIWQKINDFVQNASQKSIEAFSAYSMIQSPMTSCGCFEAISAILATTNGIMIVDRDYSGETPVGMKFSTLAGEVGGGRQTEGFIGHSRKFITSKKFIKADGGIKRIVWMPKALKEMLKDEFVKRAAEEGVPDLLDKIADETAATSEEQVLEFITAQGHPALEMDPMF